ncbi:uncharacterized protein [Choristoneura fumiferana]|uniref:uncharacterized protein n=1 Tax=Choristoneura fumiferana TaxID=7141 RepID=UPI003D157012
MIMFMFCASYIFWIILPFEYVIRALQKSISVQVILLDIIHIAVFVCIQTLTLFALCIRNESFYREINQTKRLSVCVMARCFDGPLRTKAKNTLNLIEGTPPRFSVYGMYDLNARLLFKIFYTVTSSLICKS